MQLPQFAGVTLTTLGELLIGFSILRVHWRVSREHRIDQKVIKTIYTEEFLTVLGMILIIVGYFLEVPGGLWVQLF